MTKMVKGSVKMTFAEYGKSTVYNASIFSELLNPSPTSKCLDEALCVFFSIEPWSLKHFSPCTKWMGLWMTVIQVWPCKDRQEGSGFMKEPSFNRVRDCCIITHPLNKQEGLLAWGSVQGYNKMLVSRLQQWQSLGSTDCMTKNSQLRVAVQYLPAFNSPEFGANCGPCCILDLPKSKQNVRNESDRLTY